MVPPASASSPRPPLAAAWACAGVFAATVAAYFPVLSAGFVWNDADYVTRPDLQPWSGLWNIWFRVGATEQYYPLLHSAFWLEHRLWGDSTLGYHLLNVLLHATAACLFAFTLREVWRPKAPGAEWIAALLFALHPVCVESVAWVSEEKNTLCIVFYLLAALFYLRWKRPDARTYALATGCFALAVLTKSVAATLPAALLVLAWWRRGRVSWRDDVVPVLPWFALSILTGCITGWVEHAYVAGSNDAGFALSFGARCLVAGRAAVFYLWKLVWPHPLVFFYPRWVIDTGSVFQWLFPLAVLGALAGLWLLRRRSRAPLAVGLYFVGTLFPVLGFLSVYAFRFSFVADHFQYLAALGPIAALAAVLPLRVGRVPRAAYVALPLCLLGLMTFRQTAEYHDVETFYRATLARNPDAWIAHNNLGEFLLNHNRTREAQAEFKAALRIRPAYPEAESNLGLALIRRGQIDEGIAHYRTAIRLDPRCAEAYANLGDALLVKGNMPEAVAAMEQALRLEPVMPPILSKLGPCLFQLGRGEEAIPFYQRALAAGARDSATYNNLGGLLMATGHVAEAEGDFRESLRLDPDVAVSHENLGMALAAQGRFADAAAEFRIVLRLEPNNADAQHEWSDAAARARQP